MKDKADIAYDKALAAVKDIEKAMLVAERAFQEIDSIGMEEVVFALAKAQDAMDNCERLLAEADEAANY